MNPCVYVFLLAYNSACTINESLASLANQNYDNMIIYIMNNASIDNTAEIVRKFEQQYNNIKLYNFERNVGLFGNWERCIKMSNDKYTVVCHSDDIYSVDFISHEVKFLEENIFVGAVTPECYNINSHNKVIGVKHVHINRDIIEYRDTFPYIVKNGNMFITSGIMVRTNVYKNIIKSFNLKYGGAADFECWLRILRKYPFGIIHKPLVFVRSSINSITFCNLLNYENTLFEYENLVLMDYINHDWGAARHRFLNDMSLRHQREYLNKSVSAYLLGEYQIARKFWQVISFKELHGLFIILAGIFGILIHIPIPYFLRRVLAYIRYYPLTKGEFKNIKFDKFNMNDCWS